MLRAAVHREPVDGLLEEWAALFARDPAVTPFSSPHWAEAWWPHFGTGREPFCVTVRDGADELRGLAPLAREGRGPIRTLHGIGLVVGNYWDVLAAPEDRPAVVEAVLDGLLAVRGGWDGLVLEGLEPESWTAGRRCARRGGTPAA